MAQPTMTRPKPNLPPQIVSLRITPDTPRVGDLIRVTVEAKDPEGDSITLRYKWYVNGQGLPTETGDSLGSQFFKKGDMVMVEVRPMDGRGEGNPFSSPPVLIGNTPPEVASLRLTPTLVYPGDKVMVEVVGRDVDGDSLSYIYEWRRNGNILPGETGGVLDTRGFKKMDLVSVTVTPFDGEARGKPRRSLPIVIANTPPEITSTPTTTISNGKYIYEVKAVDPDEDTLTFSLEGSPPGMTIDPATGHIEWNIPPEPTGSFQVKVIVTDGDAKAFQVFNLSLK